MKSRSTPEQRRAVLTLLQDEEWGRWGDREIARRAGVHHEMVGRLREDASGGNRQIERLVERNGVTYQQNTANIGRPMQPVAVEVRRELGERRGRNNPQNIAELKGAETRDIAARKAGFGNPETYRQRASASRIWRAPWRP